MSIDVLPDPVGPSTRLTLPRLNVSPSSMKSLKTRRDEVGVIFPSSDAVQVKEALRKPIMPLSKEGVPTTSLESLVVVVNSSSNSVS